MKTNKIILSIIALLFIVGCKATYKEEQQFSVDSNPEKIALKNTAYFDKCKNEYKNSELINNGEYQCENDGLTINVGKYEKNYGLSSIDIKFKELDKNKILKEINFILELQNIKTITMQQLEMILSNQAPKTSIGNLYFIYSTASDKEFNSIRITTNYNS